MGRPRKKTELSPEARTELERWLRAAKTPQFLAQRARIVLGLAEGGSVEEVAAQHKTTAPRVRYWRRRYELGGVEGLKDRPRPGRPTMLDESTVLNVLKLSREHLPQEATHWSVRLMAAYAKTTVWRVRQVWKKAGLRPHLLKTFKLSRDPLFGEKVVDIVGLYMSPPAKAMVLAVDEKTQIQALERTQKGLRLEPGKTETRTHDYRRHGTATLYAAFDISTGRVMGRITKRHRSREFLDFLRQIDRNTPQDLVLHLVVDNSSTHKTAAVRNWLAEHPRFQPHFTPTSASWLNAVEGWFGQLERRALVRGSFTGLAALRKELRRYIDVHNEHLAKPFVWTQTAEAILTAVEEARKALRYG